MALSWPHSKKELAPRPEAVAAREAQASARRPHNIEAEQALLGAILVNNDAFDRVSDFLEPEHFSEELHRRIYDIAGQLIRVGKVATPVTLKTFLGEHDLGGMTIRNISRASPPKPPPSSTPRIMAAPSMISRCGAI